MPLRHTVHEVTLKNGAKGLIIDVPGTTAVSYEFNFRAGNDFVARPEIQQTAHILEHLLLGANQAYETAELFSQEFSRNGAYSNATTWDYSVSYYGTSALMEVGRIMDLWQLALTKPLLSDTLLDAEKGNVREELEGDLGNPGRQLAQQVERNAGNRSFLDSEKLATIDAITLADIEEHYRRTHTAANMRFVIAGALVDKIDELTHHLEQWELPGGERLAVRKGIVRRGEMVHMHRDDLPALQFHLHMSIGRELTIRETDTFGALNHILTGTLHSRIYGKARSLGLCYGIDSEIFTAKDGVSDWDFSGGVSLRNAEGLFSLIADELRRLYRDGVSEAEMAEAKSFAIGKIQLRGQTSGDIADEYTGFVFGDEPIEYLDDAESYIRMLRRDDMSGLVREFIDAANWTFGEIGAVTAEETRAHEQILARIFEPGDGGV